MFEFLMAALRSGDISTVCSLLIRWMPASMLYSMDQTESNIIHYLARFNQPEALALARAIFPVEKFTA